MRQKQHLVDTYHIPITLLRCLPTQLKKVPARENGVIGGNSTGIAALPGAQATAVVVWFRDRQPQMASNHNRELQTPDQEFATSPRCHMQHGQLQSHLRTDSIV